MKIDMHVHLADIESPRPSSGTGRATHAKGYLGRVLHQIHVEQSGSGPAIGANERCIQRMSDWVKQSPLDKAVLLALDEVVDESGLPCPERTVLHVDNDFVCSAAARHPEFLFGASIHPYRRDAVQELERLTRKGACLVKWIPSGQRIEPDSPACFPFYEALAHYGVPLLSHTGIEHMLGSRRSRYNHPKRLIPALERGVTVIAAHCGVHLFLHELSFFRSWARLARDYENLYGDTGAFAIVTRVPQLRQILGDSVLESKLIYGSDFPGIPSPRWCWQLGVRTMRRLARMENPLARNLHVMRELGMPEQTTERAYDSLGIGKEVPSHEC